MEPDHAGAKRSKNNREKEHAFWSVRGSLVLHFWGWETTHFGIRPLLVIGLNLQHLGDQLFRDGIGPRGQ